MWRGLTQLLSQLTVVSELLREQNSLLRETIRQSSGRPAQTPVTKHSHVLHPRPETLPPPKTDADVWYPGKPEAGKQITSASDNAWNQFPVPPPPFPAPSPAAHPASSATTKGNSSS